MNKPLNILIFAADKGNRPAHFVGEQINALKQLGNITIHCCLCPPNTNLYVKFKLLRRAIRQYHPNIIHAHFGLYGFVANWQRNIPVVTTYHGSDIHGGGLVAKLSKISACLSDFNIYVSDSLRALSHYKGNKAATIPCGVNVENFVWMNKEYARSCMHLDKDKKYILFASDFETPVKDPELAFQTIEELKRLCPEDPIELIELKGYSREEVNALMHGADAVLMTSYREGSPQFIKEAVICGTPIVTVNVGDVEQVLYRVENAFIAKSRSAKEIADLLKRAINVSHLDNGAEHIRDLGLDNKDIAIKIRTIYQSICKK